MKALNSLLYIIAIFILCGTVPSVAQNTMIYNEKVFGGTEGDIAPMILKFPGNSYIVAGISFSGLSGNKNTSLCTPDTSDLWIMKLDTSLNIIWEQSVGGRFFESSVFSTLAHDSGSVIVALASDSDSSCFKSEPNRGPSPGLEDDYWIVIIDSSGNVTNDITWGGPGGEIYPKCYQLSDGNLIVTGTTWSGIGGDKSVAGFGDWDYWVVKFDTSGNKLWDQVYGGTDQEQGPAIPIRSNFIINTDSGHFYLFGSTWSGIGGNITTANIGGFPNLDWLVWLVDENGNILWQTRYGGTGTDKIHDAIKTNDGGLLLIGTTKSPVGYDVTQPSIGNTDCWIVKVDSLSNIQWDHRYGSSDIDECICGVSAPDGGYYIGGNTRSPIGFDVSEPPFSAQDYWIFKIDNLGNKIWDKRYGGSNSNSLHNFVVLPDTSIILSGSSEFGSSSVKSFPGYGGVDYWLVHMKYTDSLTSTNEPVLSQQIHLYPNPSNGTLQIPGFLRDASVTISDVTGRGIAEIPVPESATLDLSYLPNGCYHIRFVTKQGNYYAKWIKM